MTENGKIDHFEGWKREFKPKRIAVDDIILDGPLVLALEKARAELKAAQKELEAANKAPEGQTMFGESQSPQERVEIHQQTVDDLETDIDAKRHSLVVHSIGRHAWRDLIEDHRKGDDEDDGDSFPFLSRLLDISALAHVRVMSFPPAVLAACTVEIDGSPGEMSPEFAEWVFENVADDERARLLTACLDANMMTTRAPKKADTARALTGGTK